MQFVHLGNKQVWTYVQTHQIDTIIKTFEQEKKSIKRHILQRNE